MRKESLRPVALGFTDLGACKGLGESMYIKVLPIASPFPPVFTDNARASLYMESLTTSRRSRDGCLNCKETFGWFVGWVGVSGKIVCFMGRVGVSGKIVWLNEDVSIWAVLFWSRDEKLEEREEDEKEDLDDSVETLCFSFTSFFGIFSCNCKWNLNASARNKQLL